MSYSSIARTTWSRQNLRKWSAQKLALWRRRSMTAGPRHTAHFIGASSGGPSPGAAGDHGADLDHVVVGQHGVARHQRVAPHDEDRLAVEVEPAQQLSDAERAVDLELAPRVAEQDAHDGSIVAPTVTGDERSCPRRSRSGGRSGSCRRA